MGASFTSIHVRVGSLSDAQKVVADLVRRATWSDFVEVGDGDEVDRSIAIAPPLDGWVSVYDTELEMQAEQSLAHLASALSVDHRVVTILVHDSDVLDLRLFEDRQQVDHFVSDPDFLELSKADRARTRGHASAWSQLLVPSATPEALEAAWSREEVFAENLAVAVAKVIGLDSGRAQSQLADLSGSSAPGVAWIRLRARRRSQQVTSPPRLALAAFSPSAELSVGEAVQQLGLTISNAGGGTRGLAVGIVGDGLPFLALDAAHVATRYMAKGDGFVRASAPLVAAPGGAGLVATFPDFEVPPAPAAVPAAPAQSFHQLLDRQIFVNFTGTASAPGRGRLQIGVVPLAHPAGAAAHVMSVAVGSPSYRPLRSRPEYAAQLRALDDPAVLSLVATLPRADAAGCREVVSTATAWIRELDANFEITIFPALGAKLRKARISRKDVGGLRWTKLFDELPRVRVIAGMASIFTLPFGRDSRPPFHRAPGFSFQRGSSLYADPDPVLLLGLWRPARGAADEGRLAEIGDRLIAAGGLQAFMARWAWAPYLGVESSPYELAAGVHGQTTSTRHWNERWLRAVTRRFWIGEPLRQRVDLAAVASAATVTPVGTGVRVELPEDVSPASLEAALADVLPSHDDWIAARSVLPLHSVEDRDRS